MHKGRYRYRQVKQYIAPIHVGIFIIIYGFQFAYIFILCVIL